MNANENPQPEVPIPSTCPHQDARLVEALEQYLEVLETGHKPNREEFLEQHADIAIALAECLDGMEALHAARSASQQSPVPCLI